MTEGNEKDLLAGSEETAGRSGFGGKREW